MSFRLSQKEYENLRELCIAHGVRSMSDFARLATQQWLEPNGANHDSVLTTLMDLKGRIRELDSEVKQLAQRTRMPAPVAQPSGEGS